jgi:two-component system LytT family response regulator
MVYKYLIIEDNPTAIQTIDLLMQDFPEFQKTISSFNLKEGIRAALLHKPDLIFVDVELPDFTGFDFIATLRSHLQELPEIIIHTAHEKYALEAVNEEILYYLLKPMDPDELLIAINRFRTKKAKVHKKISIKTQKGYSFLHLEDVFLITSSSNYTYFFTKSLQKILVSKTMKEFEPFLGESFLRVHKSYVINTSCIRYLNTTRKKVQLLVPELSDLPVENDFLRGLSHLLVEENNLEIPIGEAFLDKVRNTVLYNKLL